MATNEFANARSVLVYYPIKNEISPLPLVEAAQRMGKSVAFPVCDTKNHTLSFKKVNSIYELSRTSSGLFEPKADLYDVEIDETTVCVVPALAFSREGHRVGYGMGYYDRFLEAFVGKSIGLSYSALLCDTLPHEEHDAPLDMIITESEVLYIA